MSNMKHRTILPDNKLRPFIQYYWIVKDDSEEHLQLSMADGFTCIRFFRGGEQSFIQNIGVAPTSTNAEWEITVKNNDMQTVSSGILGPRISSYALVAHKKIETIGVKFTMLGAQRMFGEKLGYLSDKYTNLSDFNDKSLISLESTIMNTSLQNCISCMEDYFLKRFSFSIKECNSDEIVNKVLLSCITSAKLADLADSACCSVRTLNRIIDAYTGLTPKQIIRIARLSTTIKKMIDCTHLKCVDLQGIASDCGFYDLPHMTKEMKTLCGYTPLQCVTFFRKYLDDNKLWVYQQGDTLIWGKVQDSSFRWCQNGVLQQSL